VVRKLGEAHQGALGIARPLLRDHDGRERIAQRRGEEPRLGDRLVEPRQREVAVADGQLVARARERRRDRRARRIDALGERHGLDHVGLRLGRAAHRHQ